MKNKNYFYSISVVFKRFTNKSAVFIRQRALWCSYYHEYMPYERLDEDIRLMKRAGLTVVRVGESAWGSI